VVEIVPENGGFLDLWSILHSKNRVNAIHFLEPDRACKAGEVVVHFIESSCARKGRDGEKWQNVLSKLPGSVEYVLIERPIRLFDLAYGVAGGCVVGD
jgi:hypothetical protein